MSATNHFSTLLNSCNQLKELELYSGTITHQIAWPRSIRKLCIKNSVDIDLDKIENLPSTLQELNLNDSFDKPIDNLPAYRKMLIALCKFQIQREHFNCNWLGPLPNNFRTLSFKASCHNCVINFID